VASSSSREELEEMYSGVSSVPKISSGSRSRLEKKQEGVNVRLQIRARNRLKENSLSNGMLLWWSVVLLDGLLSLVRHGFGVFSSEQEEKM
jgi:hypothetical protein